jgi:hypothetical protein
MRTSLTTACYSINTVHVPVLTYSTISWTDLWVCVGRMFPPVHDVNCLGKPSFSHDEPMGEGFFFSHDEPMGEGFFFFFFFFFLVSNL